MKSTVAPSLFPCQTSIMGIYAGPPHLVEDRHTSRYDDLRKRYCATFGEENTHFVRVAGLLPLAGDTDLLGGFDSLYAGTDQDILLAVGWGKGHSVLVNHCEGALGRVDLSIDPRQKFREEEDNKGDKQFTIDNLAYQNLLICGYKAAFQGQEGKQAVGMKV